MRLADPSIQIACSPRAFVYVGKKVSGKDREGRKLGRIYSPELRWCAAVALRFDCVVDIPVAR
jgi:hypothetical protein